MSSQIVNISAYRFCKLDQLKPLRENLLQFCEQRSLKGTILLSTEGINLFVAGPKAEVDALVTYLRQVPGLEPLAPKESWNTYQPFNRMLVKIKKEIIAFGVEGIDPQDKPAPKIPPKELKTWLDAGKPVTLLDTRNEYEIKLGTFKGAINPHLDHFRNFPKFVESLPPKMKEEPIVMFCTGGIRCEKAGPFMQKMGFKNIFQLEGGILKYFEEVGNDHYEGDCFVFDGRVGVDPSLAETPHKLCFGCLAPLTPEDQKSPLYIPGKKCPYCFEKSHQQMSEQLKSREKALEKFAQKLPGAEPYQQRRPIKIPQSLDGATLVDCLSTLLRHISRQDWIQEIERGLFETEDGAKVTIQQRVKKGERYFHVLPQASEPTVNPHIRIQYEDEALIVVEKPAPLPVQPSGRFQRNTLQYMLNEVYRPQFPRAVHRLDANTSGLMVIAKTKAFAAFLHKQFEERKVEKKYLVQVQGHPKETEFVCEAPISSTPGDVGSRKVDWEKGLPAKTHFKVLELFDNQTALLEAMPITGRTNQIRIHLWHLGFPVCGDQLYLPQQQLGTVQTNSLEDKPLCLHASELRFTHPITRNPFLAESKSPPWLGAS